MAFLKRLTMTSLALACLAALSAGAAAEETPPPTTVGTSATTEAKLVSEFSAFLGGEEQAAAVVTGLRQGTAFTLPGTPEAGQEPPPSVTVDPPTGTLGYGNVRIALRMAQSQLAAMGITQPTAEELSAMLVGGEIDGAPVDGVLALRAEGMGWGEIAHRYDTTVGQLMGRGAAKATTATTATTSRKSAPVSAAGAPAKSNGYIPSGKGKAATAGIVTGAGASVGGGNAGTKGQAVKAGGHGQGGVMVSAAGQPAAAAGVSHAGGNGKGQAPGQQKKD